LLRTSLPHARGLRLADGLARGPAPGEHRLYLYDPFSVHVLTVRGDGAARTVTHQRLGEGFAGRRFDGDPEFLERIAAAAVVHDALWLLRTDGTLSRLRDGRLERLHRAGRPGDQHFVSDGRRGALLWKQGGDAWLLMLPAESTSMRVRLGDTLPVWAGWCEAGLVAIWLDRWELRDTTGRGLRRVDFEVAPRLAAVALHTPPVPDEGDPATRGPRLVCGLTDGRVMAWAVVSGRRLWTTRPLAERAGDWQALTTHGALVLARGSRGVVVVDGDGRGDDVAAPLSALGAFVNGATLVERDGRHYLLLVHHDPRRPPDADPPFGRIECWTVGDPARPLATRAVRQSWGLPGGRPPRDVLLTPTHLLVVVDDAVYGYTLHRLCQPVDQPE
jgi:hypothetical protein